MLLPDVNALIYAHFDDIVAEQAEYARWLTRLATGSEPFALSVLVLSGFVRIATNPRIFDPPSTLENAFAFVSSLVERPTARIVGPGPDHLEIFGRLCREAGATGKLSLTLNTLRSRWSTAAPWFRPTPTSTGSPGCGGATRYAPTARRSGAYKAGGDGLIRETGGLVQDHSTSHAKG